MTEAIPPTKAFTVTFDVNNSKCTGVVNPMPAEFTFGGYELFGEQKIGSNGGLGGYTIESNTTLIAAWTGNPKITLPVLDGIDINTGTQSFKFKFGGWKKNVVLIEGAEYTPSSDVRLKAEWQIEDGFKDVKGGRFTLGERGGVG